MRGPRPFPPLPQDTTWELARLRVQVTALAAENDQLRSNAQGLALQLCEAKTAARSQLGDATLKCRQTEEAAALRTASVEEQSERQRRVLVRTGRVYIRHTRSVESPRGLARVTVAAHVGRPLIAWLSARHGGCGDRSVE